jgi:hypothetical protein
MPLFEWNIGVPVAEVDDDDDDLSSHNDVFDIMHAAEPVKLPDADAGAYITDEDISYDNNDPSNDADAGVILGPDPPPLPLDEDAGNFFPGNH